jgi:hypothetical protein
LRRSQNHADLAVSSNEDFDRALTRLPRTREGSRNISLSESGRTARIRFASSFPGDRRDGLGRALPHTVASIQRHFGLGRCKGPNTPPREPRSACLVRLVRNPGADFAFQKGDTFSGDRHGSRKSAGLYLSPKRGATKANDSQDLGFPDEPIGRRKVSGEHARILLERI